MWDLRSSNKITSKIIIQHSVFDIQFLLVLKFIPVNARKSHSKLWLDNSLENIASQNANSRNVKVRNEYLQVDLNKTKNNAQRTKRPMTPPSTAISTKILCGYLTSSVKSL